MLMVNICSQKFALVFLILLLLLFKPTTIDRPCCCCCLIFSKLCLQFFQFQVLTIGHLQLSPLVQLRSFVSVAAAIACCCVSHSWWVDCLHFTVAIVQLTRLHIALSCTNVGLHENLITDREKRFSIRLNSCIRIN